MRLEWYRQKQGKVLGGVLASLARQFGWNVWSVRAGFIVVCLLPYLNVTVLACYLLALLLPYQEDVYAERYGTGPRKRKEAQKITKGWFDR